MDNNERNKQDCNKRERNKKVEDWLAGLDIQSSRCSLSEIKSSDIDNDEILEVPLQYTENDHQMYLEYMEDVYRKEKQWNNRIFRMVRIRNIYNIIFDLNTWMDQNREY